MKKDVLKTQSPRTLDDLIVNLLAYLRSCGTDEEELCTAIRGAVLWANEWGVGVADERSKREHLLSLLQMTKMKHGVCRPRRRKACTACNAQKELDAIVAAWPGPTLHPSGGAE